MTVFERSLASSENPCADDVDRNLRFPVPDICGNVLVAGASKRLLSLGLALMVTPLNICAAIFVSPGRIWSGGVSVNRAALFSYKHEKFYSRYEAIGFVVSTWCTKALCYSGERVQKGLRAYWPIN